LVFLVRRCINVFGFISSKLSNLKLYVVIGCVVIIVVLLGICGFYYQKTKTLEAHLKEKDLQIATLQQNVENLSKQLEVARANTTELKAYYERVIRTKDKQIRDLTSLCNSQSTTVTEKNVLDLLKNMFTEDLGAR